MNIWYLDAGGDLSLILYLMWCYRYFIHIKNLYRLNVYIVTIIINIAIVGYCKLHS